MGYGEVYDKLIKIVACAILIIGIVVGLVVAGIVWLILR